MINKNIQQLIKLALQEDVGAGDITTKATISNDSQSRAILRAKEGLVLAGLDVAAQVFKSVDKKLKIKKYSKDGTFVKKGGKIMAVAGKTASLLKAERAALNFLQHLSGIATLTNKFVEKVKGTDAKILDTRKTTPCYRTLEKYAVKMGGAFNHRFGLHDRYLIKNNHIAAAGSIENAIALAKLHRRNKKIKIEVETRTLNEVKKALIMGADIIMLDNMTPAQIKRAVKFKKGKVEFEVSGNINLGNIRSYAIKGIDYISIGAITHSAKAADINMRI